MAVTGSRLKRLRPGHSEKEPQSWEMYCEEQRGQIEETLLQNVRVFNGKVKPKENHANTQKGPRPLERTGPLHQLRRLLQKLMALLSRHRTSMSLLTLVYATVPEAFVTLKRAKYTPLA